MLYSYVIRKIYLRLKIVFIYFVVILCFKIELRLKLRILSIKILRNVEIMFFFHSENVKM